MPPVHIRAEPTTAYTPPAPADDRWRRYPKAADSMIECKCGHRFEIGGDIERGILRCKKCRRRIFLIWELGAEHRLEAEVTVFDIDHIRRHKYSPGAIILYLVATRPLQAPAR